MSLSDLFDLNHLMIDGRCPGEVTAIQATVSKDGDNLCTVFFNAGGNPRVMTVEAAAVSFGEERDGGDA